jgi:hypothetical protein
MSLIKMNIIKNNHAVSVALATIMVVMIVFSVIGIALTWFLPYLEVMKVESVQQNVENQFGTLAEGIESMIYDLPGARKTAQIAVEDGSISIDDDNDRNIISYSFDSSFNFSVSEMNNKDNSFQIDMMQGDVDTAEVYWLNDGRTCFLAGTKIAMADGSYKNIESMDVNDRIQSYDEQTGEMTIDEVIEVYHHLPEEMTDFYLVINGDLRVTPNHLMYSSGRWIAAGDFKVGDSLFCKTNMDYVVFSIEKIFEKRPTFDLDVKKTDSYFVSIGDDNDVLVHNDQNPDVKIDQSYTVCETACSTCENQKIYYEHLGDDNIWVMIIGQPNPLNLNLGR